MQIVLECTWHDRVSGRLNAPPAHKRATYLLALSMTFQRGEPPKQAISHTSHRVGIDGKPVDLPLLPRLAMSSCLPLTVVPVSLAMCIIAQTRVVDMLGQMSIAADDQSWIHHTRVPLTYVTSR